MNPHSIQAPSAVVMIRPHRFHPNPETAADNAFQCAPAPTCDEAIEAVATAAHDEVTQAAQTLEAAGVRVHLFDDFGEHGTPDSVFPNNWFSTHACGQVALYPMYSGNRRRERRTDVIEMLKTEYRVEDVIDFSSLEQDELFLEGTGAMVLDHVSRVAYTARSRRADPAALDRFCARFGFEPLCFDTTGADGQPIYHTNVMMSVATDFALIGLDVIRDSARRDEIHQRLEQTGRTVIGLDSEQIGNFAGNAIELSTRDGRVLALSQRAYDCLSPAQRHAIERSAQLLPLDVPTIEMAGGSVRCMLAGIHLAQRH
jgi:hypothetical protein